jgi:hypothetical protein
MAGSSRHLPNRPGDSLPKLSYRKQVFSVSNAAVASLYSNHRTEKITYERQILRDPPVLPARRNSRGTVLRQFRLAIGGSWCMPTSPRKNWRSNSGARRISDDVSPVAESNTTETLFFVLGQRSECR